MVALHGPTLYFSTALCCILFHGIAALCGPGQKSIRGSGHCERCPEGRFQEKNADVDVCQSCLECEVQTCQPCPDGYYTNNLNMKCKKWTNCSELGVKTNGSKTSDVVCHEASRTIIPARTTSTTRASTPAVTKPAQFSIHTVVTRGTTIHMPADDSNVLFVGLFIVGMFLVFAPVVAFSRLVRPFIINRNKPMEKTARDNSCRIPIQEEDEKSNSTIVKN
ncbi:tumor necrosis factor receptor superfamily member 4-like isoform X2 [Acipenser ruthenus]|uniref:tumor necrosis factor receptor superfamily member 4-like isoform X2 n=1 Tax=Acipenser ruthenus TaxID=7906 RepID=UPI0027419363|nr:tumor necrosis factor receptor superfamily member 4-like isoform X2 [Acipenser ruthenus]